MDQIDKPEDNRRYKWSSSATALLISIWSHDQVQNQLKMSTRNQPIWESIARYMTRKGFKVSGLQCRTRIKNMLCSYQEAERKRDPSIIEPYFDIFKRIVSSRIPKKKVIYVAETIKQPSKAAKQPVISLEDTDDEDATQISDGSYEVDQMLNQSNESYQIEYLDSTNQEVSTTPATDFSQLEKVITKAIEAQTKTITQAIKMQTEMIEKLIMSERERLETIMASERETRRQLEIRLDSLLSRLETSSVPHLTYMGTVIEPRQNEEDI